jgi:hypothetical protein
MSLLRHIRQVYKFCIFSRYSFPGPVPSVVVVVIQPVLFSETTLIRARLHQPTLYSSQILDISIFASIEMVRSTVFSTITRAGQLACSTPINPAPGQNRSVGSVTATLIGARRRPMHLGYCYGRKCPSYQQWPWHQPHQHLGRPV